jgi:uncharacterized membrane protein
MGMDVDYVVAKQAVDQLNDLLGSLPHGERSDICDDYEEFLEKMKKKYKKE